jgi:hypothetical protein
MSFITCKTWNKLTRCQSEYDTPLMQQALNDIEKVMQSPCLVLKDDLASTVIVTTIADWSVVIKRANTKNSWHFFRRLFLTSRAQKSWDNTEKLLQLGINTFTPIAMIEERMGPLKGRSYFLCTYLDGKTGIDYFSELNDEGKKLRAAKNLAHLLQQLSHSWVSHRDLNMSNILFINEEPWLVDLDAMRQHRFSWFAANAAKREKRRFLQNCLETPGVSREVNRLLQAVFS